MKKQLSNKITTVTIPKLSGTKVIADSNLFSYIDSDFRGWGADKKGEATKEIKVDVMEMKADATFAQLMSPDNVLTQDQILYFIENHKDLLTVDFYSTFFPFKSGDEVFVAGVYVYSDGSLRASVYRFSYDYVWLAEDRRRFVVPQLNPQTPISNDPLSFRNSDTSGLEKAIEICKANGLTVTKTY